MDYQTTLATELAIDIMMNGYHQPLVNGKANIEKIEDEIVKGIYAGELKEIDQETVNMAVMFVDDIIKEFGDLDG
jgi:hypothetical protein